MIERKICMNKDFNVKSFVEEYEKCSTKDDKIKFLPFQQAKPAN